FSQEAYSIIAATNMLNLTNTFFMVSPFLYYQSSILKNFPCLSNSKSKPLDNSTSYLRLEREILTISLLGTLFFTWYAIDVGISAVGIAFFLPSTSFQPPLASNSTFTPSWKRTSYSFDFMNSLSFVT